MVKRITTYFIKGVLIMATLMAALTGCNTVDEKATEPIITGLTAKYGKTFTVYALGDRIDKDTATAFVYADDDPTLLFTARSTPKGELVFENYAYRSVCRSVEKIVNAAFAKANIDSECFADFSAVNNNLDIGISVESYIKETSADSIVITLIAKASDAITAENLEKVYNDVYSQMSGIHIGTGLYVLTSDDYGKIAESVRLETQVFDAYRLKVHGAESSIIELNIRMTDKGMSLSADEINSALSKGVD